MIRCYKNLAERGDSTHAQTDQGLAPIFQRLPNEY
jgi:hypothetical protein